MVGTSYPFLDVCGRCWCSFRCCGSGSCSPFSRTSSAARHLGWGKTAWLIFVIILPFLGVFVYLIAESKGMAERNIERANQAQVPVRRLRAADGGRQRSEIAKAKELLDSGAITQAEFDSLKQKALA